MEWLVQLYDELDELFLGLLLLVEAVRASVRKPQRAASELMPHASQDH